MNTQQTQVMVMGFIGKMGSGKTLNMTKWALLFGKLLKMPVYANYTIHGAKKFSEWRDLQDMENIIICYDEVHVDFDSRDYSTKERYAFTHWFVQLRKRGIIFLYTTQRTDTLEKRIRNHTDYIIWCTNKRSLDNGQIKLHLTETILDTQLSLDNAIVCKTLTNKNPELIYQLYDTTEIIR